MQNAGGSYEVTTVIASGASDATFSRDGTRIYAALRNGNIQVIDAATKAIVATWDVGNSLRAISLSEDGSYLLVTEGQNPQGVSTVCRVDTATGAATVYTSPGGGFWDVEIVDADTAI